MADESFLRVLGAAVVFAVVVGVMLGRHRWAARRTWTAGVAAALVSVPLWIPLPFGPWRCVAAALSLAMAMKTLQLQTGLAPPSALPRAAVFLLWFVFPPRTQSVQTKAARWEVRRQGLWRLARGCGKAVLLLALIAAHARQTWPWPLGVLAGAFEIYFILSGLADALTALTCLLGFATDEVFAAPFAARSPADFWGRRWNLFVSGFLRRQVFAPLARGGHVYRGAAAVFLLSGLAHEYFVLVSVGAAAYEGGFMMAFFALQGVAVMAAAWWRAHLRPARFAPAWLKVSAHWLWLAATAPLFIYPLRKVLDAFEAPLRAWVLS